MKGDRALASHALTLHDLHVIALFFTCIKLAGVPHSRVGIFDHLLPLGDPSNRARHSEQRGEHGGGETHDLRMMPE